MNLQKSWCFLKEAGFFSQGTGYFRKGLKETPSSTCIYTFWALTILTCSDHYSSRLCSSTLFPKSHRKIPDQDMGHNSLQPSSGTLTILRTLARQNISSVRTCWGHGTRWSMEEYHKRYKGVCKPKVLRLWLTCLWIPNEIIFFAAKDGEALYSQQKQDWELTVAQIMNSLLQIQTQIEESRENH